MLSLNTTNKVTFNVNVFGTAATPTVRCIIGEAPGFSFPATKLDGGQYEVLIDLPKDLKLGAYPFKVEVLLNGRLFTPINHSVPVTGSETPVETSVEAPVVTPAPEIKLAEPAPVKSTLMATVTTEKTAEKVKAAEPIVFTKAPALSGLKTVAKTPVFSKPVQVEAKRSKISMADVSAAAEAIEQPKAKPTVKKPKVVETITPTVPVSLIKGTVIYR